MYISRLARPETFGKLSSEDEKAVEKHFDYLGNALKRDQLVLAGRCNDEGLGMVIFETGSLLEAQTFMENDPAVAANVMTAELHPFRVALSRKYVKGE